MPIDVSDFEKGDAPGTVKKQKKPKGKSPAIPSYGLRPPRERYVKKPKPCFQDYCEETTVDKCLYCGRFYCDEHIHTKKHVCPDVKKRTW